MASIEEVLNGATARARAYDEPNGEPSMKKVVGAFNIITGHQLTEEQGWLFMEVLKQVRSQQKNEYHIDNYMDVAACAAKRAVCGLKERGVHENNC